MAKYRVIYWKHIPSSVIVEGDGRTIKKQLSQKIQNAIDAYAMAVGLTNNEDYSAQYKRGDWVERAGTPEEVAEALEEDIALVEGSMLKSVKPANGQGIVLTCQKVRFVPGAARGRPGQGLGGDPDPADLRDRPARTRPDLLFGAGLPGRQGPGLSLSAARQAH